MAAQDSSALAWPARAGAGHDVTAVAQPIVLKVNEQSARVRLLDADGEQITFRSSGVWQVVPGHVVMLSIRRRWTWRDAAYASGELGDPHIDVLELGLEPLPLADEGLLDLREVYEPYRDPEPYAPLWRQLTSTPTAAHSVLASRCVRYCCCKEGQLLYGHSRCRGRRSGVGEGSNGAAFRGDRSGSPAPCGS